MIELFVELLTVRIQLIDKSKEIPGDMIEAVSSLVYAAQRITDLPELQVTLPLLLVPDLTFNEHHLKFTSRRLHCDVRSPQELHYRCCMVAV